MELTPVLAGRLVKKLEATQPYDVVVINADGIIVGASDLRVMGRRHKDACLRMAEYRSRSWNTQLKIPPVKECGSGRCLFVRNQLVGAVGLSGPEAQVAPYLEMAKAIAEMMLEREFDIQSSTIRNASHSQVLMRLLSPHTDQIRLREALASQHIEPDIPRTILLTRFSPLSGGNGGPLFKNALTNVLELFRMRFTFRGDLILPDLEHEAVFVLCADRSHAPAQYEKKLLEICSLILEDARDNYCLAAKVMIGPRCCSLEDYRGQYNQMLEAFQLGERMFPQLPILSGRHLILGNIASYLPSDVKRQIVRHTFQRILDHPQRELYLETLDAYFKNNMNMGETAQKLYIHRNTLQHRLKRIEELTGYCVYQLDDILTLRLAYLFYETAGA